MTTSSKARLPVSIRLTLWYGVWQFGLLILFAIVIGAAAHLDQQVRIHERLFNTQAEIMQRLELSDDGPRANPALDQLDGVYAREDPLALYVRLLGQSGSVIDATPNTVEKAFSAPTPPERNEILELDRRMDDQLIRVMYAPIIRADGTRVGWLEVSAYNLDLSGLLPARSLLIVIPLFVLVSLLGGYFLARRAMRPVAKLTETARKLEAPDLHVRLPRRPGFRDELTDLTDTFNGMLDRLEAAFERERRFTENAAHEIMNPLTALRSEAETTLRRPRSEEAYRESLETILSESVRLGSILDMLLRLARVESDTRAYAGRANWADVVRNSVRGWMVVAEDRNVELSVDPEMPAEAWIAADPALLAIIVDNLLDNALKYTPGGGRVVVSLEIDAEGYTLQIADTGCGFDPGESEVLFDRFFRSDGHDMQGVPGSGLGLALVAAVVSRLGGVVRAESAGHGLGSTFTVILPGQYTSAEAASATAFG